MSADAASLRDEISLLERSLQDARAEHAVGDLDDATLAAIELRDEARLAVARQRLDELVTATSPARAATDAASAPEALPRRSHRRRGALAALVASGLIVAAVVILAVVQPFAAAPAPVHVTAQGRVELLRVAAEYELAHDQTLRALTLYDAVLRLAPRDPEALAESGWLRYEYGLGPGGPGDVAQGIAQLRRAIVLVPTEAAAHLYYGIVLLQHDRDRAGASAQLRRAAELPESPVEQSLTAQFLVLVQSS